MTPTIFSTARLRPLLETVQAFIETDLKPLETVETLTRPFSYIQPILDEKRLKIKEKDLWGLQHRLSLVEFAQLSEVLATTPYGHYVFNCQAPDIGNMELLARFGTAEQQEQWLKPLEEGTIRSCFGMTEPQNAGSNPTLLDTTAVREGDYYRINGRKWFTTGADGAAFCIVMAITEPDAPPHKRASQIIVPTATEGYRLVENISIMGDRGDGWLSHAEVVFDNCLVPVANRIGAAGAGFSLAQERLGPGRIHHCMRWIGIAERAFDIMCRRAAQRSMGDNRLLADKQIVQMWIAESRAEIDAARLMVLQTAHNIDTQGAAATRHAISAIKFLTANMMLKVVDNAIQTCGAAGLTDAYLLSFWYRHERAARIYDGADEVHKVALAKSILKQYR